MKFLGVRLCEHDSNICYTDGKNVKYYKSERDLQIKHHGYDDLTSWKKIFNSWNLNPSEIDAIGIVLDCFRYRHIKCDESKLYENINIPIFKYMGFECPVFRIDHHYAHSLSIWPIISQTSVDFIFDGFGDDQISHSIFKNSKKVLQYKNNTHVSFGCVLGSFGSNIGLEGNPYDLAGKVMALKGYGREKSNNIKFDLDNIEILWDVYNIKNIDDQQEIFDHVRKCHEETERIYVNHFKKYSSKNDIISYTGGIAQNTIINSKIKKERPNLHIPPHCNDEGLSLGIVEFLRKYHDQDSFYKKGFPFWQSDIRPRTKPTEKTIKKVAEKLARGEIVGWYQGNGEIGPRSLGNRSILMNPSIKNGKEIINAEIKHREWFRPFGASILEKRVSDFFDWNEKSPYMLYVMEVLDKNTFPSITHVDGTCRLQTVSEDNEIYYSLIDEFEKLTGIPMLLNTSLNNGGKPICGSPNEALELFCNSGMHCLIVGNNIFEK